MRAALATALVVEAIACHGAQRSGHVVVAVTVDWEGAAFQPESLDALDDLRKALGAVPITHFVSAAYFTKSSPDPQAASYLHEAVHHGDEVAIHLHAWQSLARASGVEPKLFPSFITGTAKVLDFPDGDAGFDTDLDVYSTTELRAMLRTSRRLLEQAQLTVSSSFRAGGYLGTPKVLQAAADEGLVVDSSATDYRQPDQAQDAFLATRIHEVWPKIDTEAQPYAIGPLVELPIAATADYVGVAEIEHIFDDALARLSREPSRDVFVVIGLNQETAQDFARRVADAVVYARVRPDLAAKLTFLTIKDAGALARARL
jgi:hypothetical protein